MKYLCYLLDSCKIIETDNPDKIDYELKICTETEFEHYKPITKVIQ